jgi:hypothetical protein
MPTTWLTDSSAQACSLLASSNQRALEMLFSPLAVSAGGSNSARARLAALWRVHGSLHRLALHCANDAELHWSKFIAPVAPDATLDGKKYLFLARAICSVEYAETFVQCFFLTCLRYVETYVQCLSDIFSGTLPSEARCRPSALQSCWRRRGHRWVRQRRPSWNG